MWKFSFVDEKQPPHRRAERSYDTESGCQAAVRGMLEDRALHLGEIELKGPSGLASKGDEVRS